MVRVSASQRCFYGSGGRPFSRLKAFVVSSCYPPLSSADAPRPSRPKSVQCSFSSSREHNSSPRGRAITRRAQATGRGPARVRPAPPRGAQRQPHGAAGSGGAHSTARRQPRAPRPCVPAHRLHSCRRAETTAIFSRPRAHWLGSVVVARPCCAKHCAPDRGRAFRVVPMHEQYLYAAPAHVALADCRNRCRLRHPGRGT